MKNSLANFAKLSIIICLLNGTAFADFREHFDLGQNYLTQYQYSGAITEFKSALRINYMDASARIGLVNSYLARAAEYANRKTWDKAANDYRSALFYLKYYPASGTRGSTNAQIEQYLDICLDAIDYNIAPENRFNTAKKLRAQGEFAAAAYEFNQALGDTSLQAKSFEQVGDIMKILGNEPKAAEYYKKAVFVNPTDLNLRLTYAKILDNQGSSDDALKEYSYVLERINPESKDTLYSLERIFSKKVIATPNNANLNANLGAVLQKQGRLDEALNYYRQAETLDPSNINTRINTGTLYQQKGDYRTAIKAYESVLILYPNNVNALLYRAQCFDKLGDSKVAQEGFQKVLALDPDNTYIKTQIVESAKKTMTPQEFVTYVNTKAPQGITPADTIYNYAIELHKAGKTDDALFMYQSAIKANPQLVEIYINMALAQAQQNKLEEALQTLNTAQAKFPNDETVASTLKDITNMKTDNLLAAAAKAYGKKDYKTAINTYLAIQPATIDTTLGIATAYQEMGDRANAITYYKKALELKPIDSDIAYAIACLYGEDEDYANAKEYLQKSIAFNKNNTQALDYLKSIEDMEQSNLLNDAIALYEANNLDDSFNKFNQILAKDSKNAYALYYRGMINEAKEKRYDAIRDLKNAYELNKDFTICNYLIASDYDALEKYKEAYTYYTAYADSNVQDDEYKQYAKARAEELKEYAK
ncbi:MAG: tetratricopeptide repeat protein [Muribaculaceae bacterium]|nr:tetratricopeptide repeat protein [Muribaculaceae bacterium]